MREEGWGWRRQLCHPLGVTFCICKHGRVYLCKRDLKEASAFCWELRKRPAVTSSISLREGSLPSRQTANCRWAGRQADEDHVWFSSM